MRKKNKKPDFYLASSEGYNLEMPHNCYLVKLLQGLNPDGYLLVEIDPPIIGQSFGLGDKNISQLILARRHREDSIQNITNWPIAVHVARPLKLFNEDKSVNIGDIESIAWAELYPTYDRALKKE